MKLIKKKGNNYFIDCIEYGIDIIKHTLVLRQGKDGQFRLALFARKQYENLDYAPELVISNDQCVNFKVCYSKHGSFSFIFKTLQGDLKSLTFFEIQSRTVEDNHLIVNQLPDTSIMTVAPYKLKVRIPLKNNL